MTESQAPMAGKTVLYVDNDPIDVLALKRSFQKLGAKPHIEVTESAERALAKLNEMPEEKLPDAMIVDLRMPGLGGLLLIERTQAHERWSQIPRIVFSTSDLASDRSAAMSAGATDYVVKRMDTGVYSELLAVLERVTVTH